MLKFKFLVGLVPKLRSSSLVVPTTPCSHRVCYLGQLKSLLTALKHLHEISWLALKLGVYLLKSCFVSLLSARSEILTHLFNLGDLVGILSSFSVSVNPRFLRGATWGWVLAFLLNFCEISFEIFNIQWSYERGVGLIFAVRNRNSTAGCIQHISRLHWADAVVWKFFLLELRFCSRATDFTPISL